jgi:hypothetical protein
MTPNNRRIALAVVLLFSAIPAARATLATAATFDQKVENAATIIVGKCVKTESKFDPSGRWILTYSTFEVEQTMKGIVLPQVTIVMPGGQVGSIHQDTIGIPAFREGSENVLFVKNTRLGPTVLYFDQGAYDVARDEHGERIVTPVPSNVVQIDTQRGMAVAPSDTPRTLRDFQRDIDQSLRAARDRKQRMDTLAAERLRREASLWNTLKGNKWIVALALAGIAFATWQFLRRA